MFPSSSATQHILLQNYEKFGISCARQTNCPCSESERLLPLILKSQKQMSHSNSATSPSSPSPPLPSSDIPSRRHTAEHSSSHSRALLITPVTTGHGKPHDTAHHKTEHSSRFARLILMTLDASRLTAKYSSSKQRG